MCVGERGGGGQGGGRGGGGGNVCSIVVPRNSLCYHLYVLVVLCSAEFFNVPLVKLFTAGFPFVRRVQLLRLFGTQRRGLVMTENVASAPRNIRHTKYCLIRNCNSKLQL